MKVSWTILAGCLALLTGCAATGPLQPVRTGDYVQVAYTCRLTDGTIAVTTSATTAEDAAAPKAGIFKPQEQYAPLVCRVGADEDEPVRDFGGSGIQAFESVVERELKHNLGGLPLDKVTTLSLEAPNYEGLSPRQRYYTEAQVRARKKLRTISLQKHIEFAGSAPRIGETYEAEKGFSTTIVDVDEASDTITLETRPIPGAVYNTDFGPARIEDHGDYYHIVIDVSPGQLVRNGNWVGRVDKVARGRITVDWGNPFGYEPLRCEVMVRSADKGATAGLDAGPRR